MNTFIYEDNLTNDGYDWFDVCYPIRTEMSKDDLIAYIILKAEEFKKENPKEDTFYPFGDKDYPASVSTFLAFNGVNFSKILTIEEWEGVKI